MEEMNYLEIIPPRALDRQTSGAPKDAVPFVGIPRRGSTPEWVMLVQAPLSDTPEIMEFSKEDILYAEEAAGAIDDRGAAAPQMKLWIRKGGKGMRMMPFVVR